MTKYLNLCLFFALAIFCSSDCVFSEEQSSVTKFQQYNQTIPKYEYSPYYVSPFPYLIYGKRGKGFGHAILYYPEFAYSPLFSFGYFDYMEREQNKNGTETFVPVEEYSVIPD